MNYRTAVFVLLVAATLTPFSNLQAKKKERSGKPKITEDNVYLFCHPIPLGLIAEKSGIELAAKSKASENAAAHRVVLSRDREKKLHDRSLVDFDIRVSVDGKTWKTVNRVRAGKVIARILRRD